MKYIDRDNLFIKQRKSYYNSSKNSSAPMHLWENSIITFVKLNQPNQSHYLPKPSIPQIDTSK